MMMVVPINAHVDKTQHVAREYRHQGCQRRELGAVRQLQLQHHDGDDDREHTITEGFESVRLHCTDVTGGARHAAIDWRYRRLWSEPSIAQIDLWGLGAAFGFGDRLRECS